MGKDSRLEKGLAFSDIHFCQEDKRAVALFLDFAEWYGPDFLCLAGDALDGYACARYLRHPDSYVPLRKEFDALKAFLKELRRRCPKARIVYLKTNHESRIDNYILEKAPEIYSEYRLSERLGLDSLDIELIEAVNGEPEVKWADLTIGHWQRSSKESGVTVGALMRDRGISMAQAHIHRSALVIRNLAEKLLVGYELGSLCRQNQDYGSHFNWNLGWLALYSDGKTSWGYPIVLKDYRFVFEGRLFGG